LLSKQEERFRALERLTTFELRNARQKQLEAAKKEKEEKEKLERELAEAHEREIELQRAREQEEKEAREDAEEKERKRELVDETQLEISMEASLEAGLDDSLPSPVLNGTSDDISPLDEEERELKIGEDGIKMLGYLSRKPTKESQNKKAHGRVWKQFYAVLKNSDMIFFRNEKEAQLHLKPIQTVTVLSSKVEVASDYHKKKNVLRLSLSSGAEYLMQCESADEMSQWIQHIRGNSSKHDEEELKNRILAINTTPVTSQQNTNDQLAGQDSGKKDKKSRSSLFSKKKKSGKSESKLDT